MTKKKIGIVVAIVVCLAVVAGVLGMLRKNGGGPKPPQSTETGTVNYSIEVKTEGGMALSEVGVFVYEDDSMEDLVWVAKTDDTGKVTFDAPASEKYVAVLQDVPAGYQLEEVYAITEAQTQIVLATMLVEQTEEAITYKLGDIVYDFTVTSTDGTEYKISELLKEKKAVVLNFWYLECEPCKSEFPYMQEAYELHKDNIEVLAMNPVNTDVQEIADFKESNGLTFPMAACDYAWEGMMDVTSYPTTVVIDRYGVISMIHEGAITNMESFDQLFAYYTAEDYQQIVVEDMEEIVTYEPEEGSIDNATEVGGVNSIEATVKPGQVVYYDVYKVSGMYFQISDPDVYVIYNEKTYYPTNGVVGFVVDSGDTYTPVTLGIGNAGSEEKTFYASFAFPKGTHGNPYTAEIGEFSSRVNAGNDQGVYYKYVAEETGVLTLECTKVTSGIDYDFTLYNLDSYEYRNWAYDGKETDEGNSYIQISVKKGQEIQIVVATLPDESNEYPSGNFDLKLYYDEDAEIEEEKEELIAYGVTITDGNRKPVEGVKVKITGENQNTVTLSTNKDGEAAVNLAKGTYKAVLVVPIGYSAYTTEVSLTEKHPFASLKMDNIKVETKTYTVKVVDGSGNPIKGVLVSVGDSYKNTNKNGQVTFELPEGDYSAFISFPAGYTADTNTFDFAEGKTKLTIKLRKDDGSGEDVAPEGTVKYTVKVADYEGKVMKNVLVRFYSGNKLVNLSEVNAKGSVSAYLTPGNYKVSLAFPEEGKYYYEESKATLSETKTTMTIKVAKRASEYEQYWYGDTYKVTAGGTYTKMQANSINYYMFRPTKSGVYKISTSNPKAVLSYWGGNTNFVSDQTSSTDYKNNSFTIEVQEDSIGEDETTGMVCIIGITGADECVLVIEKIAEAEERVKPVNYEGTHTPKQFKLKLSSGEKLKYVSLTSKSVSLVYNSSDGYYHYNKKNGPVVYMNLGLEAPYISMEDLVSVTSFTKYFYNGDIVKKIEDYTTCMTEYVSCSDETYGVYPLTDDLIYMIKNGGEQKGWYDKNSATYLFDSVSGLNTENAWMFLCCYVD